MARRKNKEQMLKEMFKRPQKADRPSLEDQKNLNLKRKTMNPAAAAKRYSLPRTLKRSVIRQICRLPPEACSQNTEAQVKYFNSNYGRNKNANLSRPDCHKPTCPQILSSIKAKENLRMSPASRQRSQKTKKN